MTTEARGAPVDGSADAAVALLGDLVDGARVRAIEPLGRDVMRVRFDARGGGGSVIVKRLDPGVAWRTELLVSRWLPAVGMASHGPPLIARRSGEGGSVWHAYADLGSVALGPTAPRSVKVEAAARVVARLHVAFTEHPMLPECWDAGGNLGGVFYRSSVRQATEALQVLNGSTLSGERRQTRDRLLRRLHFLERQASARTAALEDIGAGTTLLHGDLWPQNLLVASPRHGGRVRLIDWDRAGAGPIAYDLSTLLLRLPPQHRQPAFQAYAREVGRAGWRIPGRAHLQRAFETAELARLANWTTWPAREAAISGLDWTFEDLRRADRWFEELLPVART